MPVERKRRTGRSPTKDSAGRALPTPLTVLPSLEHGPPPVPLSLEEVGREAWRRLWTAGAVWLSPATDVDMLTRLCQSHDERGRLLAALAEDGHFVAGQRGGLVAHPGVAMLRAVNAEIMRMESLCGFTPSDRSRLGYAEVKRTSALDQLVARRTKRGAGVPR